MKTAAVLFDLDGTLLPMDQDLFIKKYFESLAYYMSKHGYDPKQLAVTVYRGSMKMMANDSGKTNEAVFWDNFASVFGKESLKDIPLFEEYYKTEFQKLSRYCGYTESAKRVVGELKQAGIKVILATNPVFPAVATESRIRWAGLDKEDFEFITTYENSYHCKPSAAYYREVTETAGVRAEECIMVGNDVSDDMPAENLGMKVFLLTDCLINTKGKDISPYPNGGFDGLSAFLKENI